MKQKTVTFGYMHHNRLYYIAFSFNTWIILHSWMRCILQCSNQALWFDWVGLDISQNDNKQFLFSFVFIPNQLQRFFFMINHLLIWIYIWTELIMGIQQRDMTWQYNLGIQHGIQHGNTTPNSSHGNMTVLSRGRLGLLGGGPGYGGPALL